MKGYRGYAMDSMKRAALLALILIGLCVSAGCFGPIPGAGQTETEYRTVAAGPGREIVVQNRNGNVHLEAWDRDYVEITAEMRTSFFRSELDRAEIPVSDSDTLLIETRHSGQNVRVQVDYRINVPADAEVTRITTTNGAIVAENARVARAEASNGPITLRGTRGDVSMVTSNGPIEVEDVSGFVAAATSNGGITARNVSGIADLKASNGAIVADLPAMRDDVSIATSNGAVTIRVSAGLDADVLLQTSNGRIAVHDLPLTFRQYSDRFVQGVLGSGGHTLSVSTSNAAIELFPLS
ncbi:MAG: DUF4097 family beta strand repeat protein [Methanomicrobiaceae archaeon]|uniref:DUF4097 domain-containing protein n=1 Tax=hydrocarbon metagenome TaxID=938273 RepID=A0A0W8FDK5_9ZZZZ|nr:DUF4097 family beta strand repeat protein [Methanomicrobiaceae archaeon]